MIRTLAALAALALVVLAPVPAAAFKGCAAGAHTGISAASDEVSLAGVADNGAVVSGLAGISVSCMQDLSAGARPVYAGVQVDGDLFRRASGAPVILGVTGSAPSRRAAAVGRLGWMATPYTGIFAEAGWGWAWDKDIAGIGMPTFKGPVAGFGIETVLLDRLHLELGYRAMWQQDESIVTPAGVLNREPQDHTVRLGVKLYFVGGLPTATPLK